MTKSFNLSQVVDSTGATNVGYTAPFTGAVARTQSSKNAESVSVLDFGADPTGFTDSTNAIQTAINLNPVVYFPAGTYKISGVINLKRNLILFGEGSSTTINQTADASAFVFDESISGTLGRDIKIRDMYITKATQTSTVCQGIYLRGTTDNIWGADLYGVNVSNFYDGIRIDRPILTTLTRCECNNNYNDGFSFYGSGTSLSLRNCWGRVNGANGHRFSGSLSYINLDACAADGNTANGYYFAQSGGTDYVYSASLNGCGAESNTLDGFVLENAENIALSGCFSYSNTGNGYTILGARGITFSSSRTLLNKTWGIGVATSSTSKTPSTVTLIGTVLSGDTSGRIQDTSVITEILSPEDNQVILNRPLSFQPTATTGTGTVTSRTFGLYEAGTFVPTIYGGTTAGVGTYTTQLGEYSVCGKVVTISLRLDWTAHTGTGITHISGIPFAAGSSFAQAAAVYHSGLTLTASNTAQVFFNPGTTSLILAQVPVGGGAATNVPINNSGTLVISASYFTS